MTFRVVRSVQYMNIKTVFHITLAAISLNFAVSAASAQTSTVVPHLLDGTNYRTIIYIQNFSRTTAEPYVLNMMNEDGTAALFHVAELGGVTGSLSGTLQPLAVAIYHTNGGAALPPQGQVGWAKLDPFNTGLDVSVWVIIESFGPEDAELDHAEPNREHPDGHQRLNTCRDSVRSD